jgi:putative hydrolase of the HAD superfamily
MRQFPAGVRLLLFDAGNTLLFVDYAFLARAARQVGASSVTASEIHHAEAAARVEVDRLVGQQIGTNDASRWRRYYQVMMEEAGMSTAQFEAAVPSLQERHRTVGLWIVVKPWTRHVLGRLRQAGYRMAVVSNADGRVESWLRHKGLGTFFETIVDSHVVGIEKPDAGIFRIALERTGFEPRQAIHVGDLYSVDVVGARGAGVTPVLLDPHGMHPADDCIKIRRLADLVPMLPALDPEREARKGRSVA